MNLAEQFAEHAVTALDLSRYVRIDEETPVRDVVGAMNDADCTCACVTAGDMPMGILTDRDVLTRVVGYPMTWDMPVEAVMTPEPETVQADASVEDALELMNAFRFRNVPVVDGSGALLGNLDRHSLLQFAASQVFSDESLATHELAAQHGLLFIDFTGLNLPTPIVVPASADLKRIVHLMRGRGIGSVLVTDDAGAMIGIFTDHDAQVRVACRIERLGSVEVGSVMTPDPISLEVGQPIADGLRAMAERRLSHVPLTGSDGQPAAIVSFRDLADYLQTTFISLA